MTIAEAKQLRIVDYLASLGYHPQSVTSKQYWYLSPLRNGTQRHDKTAAVPDGKPEADRQTGQALLLRCDPDRSLAFRRRMRGRRR